MELLLQRLYLKTEYTIGRLSVDGLYFCDTLEDRVHDLSCEPKIPGRTAIPAGRYEVTVNRSPRFTGILIHRGNTAADTSGCILVGENREPGRVVNSTPYELRLTQMLKEAQQWGEKNYITITEE